MTKIMNPVSLNFIEHMKKYIQFSQNFNNGEFSAFASQKKGMEILEGNYHTNI